MRRAGLSKWMTEHSMTSVRERIKGSIPALITPMKNGKVDEAAFRKLVSWQIEQGSQGLVPCGTTGESPTLSHEEHMRVVEICVEEAAGRVPVIAGAGSNSTEEAICVAPPRQRSGRGRGAVRHRLLQQAVAGRSVPPFQGDGGGGGHPDPDLQHPRPRDRRIGVETMARLSELPDIIGVKDATANLMRPTRERNACRKGWRMLSGEDGTALGYMAHGGHGCISVTANVAPRLCAEFQDACLRGNYDRARELHDRLMPLHDAMFCEPSPAPVKYGVVAAGLLHAGSAPAAGRIDRSRPRPGQRGHEGPGLQGLMAKKKDDGTKIIAENRKARHAYAIDSVLEAGIVLTGSEVKIAAQRQGHHRRKPMPAPRMARSFW